MTGIELTKIEKPLERDWRHQQRRELQRKRWSARTRKVRLDTREPRWHMRAMKLHIEILLADLSLAFAD